MVGVVFGVIEGEDYQGESSSFHLLGESQCGIHEGKGIAVEWIQATEPFNK
jgi:hypothetical protein